MRALREVRVGRSVGFTIIELAISISILALMLSIVGMFQVRGQKAAQAIQTISNVERRADRAMVAITQAMTGVGVHTLVPDPVTSLGADTITFQVPQSVSGAGAVTWNSPMRFFLAMDNGEIDNGLDDDRDGLVDERRLMLTRNLGMGNEQTLAICHDVAARLEGETANGLDDNGNGLVDERGFSVRRVGDLLQLRLTVQGRGEGGAVVAWTATTAMVIHN